MRERSTAVSAVARELAGARDPWTQTRRHIAALAGGLATHFAVVGMRQYGAIRHLPDPPLAGFDSNGILTSPQAFPLGIPDASLAVTGLGMMIALSPTRGSTTRRLPIMDVALGLGAATGALGAALYLRSMQKQRRWCAYCLVGASGMFALAAMTARGLARLTGR